MYTNAFQHTKIEGNLFFKVEVTGPLLAGLPLKFLDCRLHKEYTQVLQSLSRFSVPCREVREDFARRVGVAKPVTAIFRLPFSVEFSATFTDQVY